MPNMQHTETMKEVVFPVQAEAAHGAQICTGFRKISHFSPQRSAACLAF
jgi:hypothetical protein